MGDNQARLEDIGPGRIEAMDAAGIDVSILSVVTPATQALPAAKAVALARDANDEAASAVRAHPDRFRRSRPCRPAIRRPRRPNSNVRHPARSRRRHGPRADRPRPLDDPAYDDLFATAARWHQPVFIHPRSRRTSCATPPTGAWTR